MTPNRLNRHPMVTASPALTPRTITRGPCCCAHALASAGPTPHCLVFCDEVVRRALMREPPQHHVVGPFAAQAALDPGDGRPPRQVAPGTPIQLGAAAEPKGQLA